MCLIDNSKPSDSAKRNGQGENIFWKTSKREIDLEKAASDACEVWYRQIKYFDWENYKNHKNNVDSFIQVLH